MSLFFLRDIRFFEFVSQYSRRLFTGVNDFFLLLLLLKRINYKELIYRADIVIVEFLIKRDIQSTRLQCVFLRLYEIVSKLSGRPINIE